MSDSRQRFQGLCLEGQEGRHFMRNYFDELPPELRRRLAESPFNLCVACVVNSFGAHEVGISRMEARVRELDNATRA